MCVCVALCVPAHASFLERLVPRQQPLPIQEKIFKMAKHDPLGATELVRQIPHVGDVNYTSFATPSNGEAHKGSTDIYQVAWFDNGQFPFTQPDGANRDSKGGLKHCPPETKGFVLKTDLDICGDNSTRVIQPYYVTADFAKQDIKRAIVILPGLPRDAWKWATLLKNVYKWVYTNQLYRVKKGDTLILAPLPLNEHDQAAGGAGDPSANWAVYRKSTWQMAGKVHYPNTLKTFTFFDAMDKVLELLHNKSNFPHLKSVVVAGHSLGGQAVMRYALLKKKADFDNDTRYWIGNPGSWTWLTKERPTKWAHCPNEYDKWPYGVLDEQSLPLYAQEQHVQASEFVQRFRSRRVHIALGLNDNGSGDQHCGSMYQGANHLDRGSHFIEMLNSQEGGIPAKFSVSYEPGISHQDYPMLAAERSIRFFFSEG